jgi:uncharacterized protein YecE (DUF72 family)
MKQYHSVIAISHVNNKGNWTGLYTGFNPSFTDYVQTADYVYVRLHGSTGQYVGHYDTKILRSILTFIEPLKIKNAYIYFNNTDSRSDGLPDATKDALKIKTLANIK